MQRTNRELFVKSMAHDLPKKPSKNQRNFPKKQSVNSISNLLLDTRNQAQIDQKLTEA